MNGLFSPQSQPISLPVQGLLDSAEKMNIVQMKAVKKYH